MVVAGVDGGIQISKMGSGACLHLVGYRGESVRR